MKKLLVALIISTVGLNANALNVSKSKLEKVNNFIAKEMRNDGVDSDELTVKVTKVNRKLFSKKVKSITAVADFKNIVTAEAKMKIKKSDITIGVKASATLSQQDLMMIKSVLPMVQQYIDMLNTNDNFNLEFKQVSSEKGKTLTVVITPADEITSFKQSSLEVFVPKSAKDKLTAEAKITINAKDELVVKAQTALTNIFNDLVNGKVPSEDDFRDLSEVIEVLLSNIK